MNARILISGLLAVLAGTLLPYAPQAKRALYAKLARALFLRALAQVVDSTARDVVQLVRPLESRTVTADSFIYSTERIGNPHIYKDAFRECCRSRAAN